jgi:hypothetical protein
VQVPVFINCRDRLSSLLELIRWLEAVGVDEIYLLDNDSAYEPLLDYYRSTPHTVVRLGRNYGRLAMWEAPGILDLVNGRHFVFTDPDVVPDTACPADAIDRFLELLQRYPSVEKAGFGLRIDDLPDHYPHKDAVIVMERPYWRRRLERGAYFSPIDTTFALYRPGAPPTDRAIRTGPPYVARHTTWYLDFDNLPPDEAFYQARAARHTDDSPYTSHWISTYLPGVVSRAIERSTSRRPARIYRLAKEQIAWTVRERRALRRGR